MPSSDGSVHAHDEVENVLYRLKQMLAVINLDIELILDSIVNQYASFDVHCIVLIIPVRLESNRYAIPAVGVDVSQAVTADLNASLSKHVWLLVQVMMSR